MLIFYMILLLQGMIKIILIGLSCIGHLMFFAIFKSHLVFFTVDYKQTVSF